MQSRKIVAAISFLTGLLIILWFVLVSDSNAQAYSSHVKVWEQEDLVQGDAV